jgi:ribose/xylose/arabinose/galactoside ABC-type transport system permease subunit
MICGIGGPETMSSSPPASEDEITGAAVAPERRRFEIGQAINKIPIVVLGAALIIVSLYVPRFLTTRNITNIGVQTVGVALMAIGETAVLITGGIDLSIPAVMAVSGIAGAMFMHDGGHPLLAILIMLVIGVTAGAVNGYAVARLKMIPFVVTLSMMVIATGIAVWITNATSVGGIPSSFIDGITGKVAGVPVPIIILVIVTILAQLLIKRSLYGRWLYSVGTNARTSRVSGIPTDSVILGAYLVSGLFAGLAGAIITARLASAAPMMGRDTVVLDIIASCVVGGVSIYGGQGAPLGAVIGALFITSISNSMNLLGISYFTTLLIKGLVIIMAVALDSLRKR